MEKLASADLNLLKESVSPFLARITQAQRDMESLRETVGSMVQLFLRAKGLPTNVVVDLTTGEMRPKVESANGAGVGHGPAGTLGI